MHRDTFTDSGKTAQETFVLNILNHKKNGIYVEVGSGDPVHQNNTYTLETEYGWTGIGFEIDEALCKKYNDTRKNVCLNKDAITFDYRKYFEENNFPKQIDFLQIDIDDTPKNANFLGLLNIPLTEYRFSVIVFEHDLIRSYKFEELRSVQRWVLSALGYDLVVRTATEDWWVDPKIIPPAEYQESHSIYQGNMVY